MATIAEQVIIDNLAGHCGTIDGVNRSYAFAENPTKLSTLPAIVFWPQTFESQPKGHFNQWRNQITIMGSLYIREQKGPLEYLENAAMPFGHKFRQKFQDETVIRSLLGLANITQAWLLSGNYGAGDQLLTYMGITYIGWIFTWQFLEIS
jgi:hypothetical protein